MINLWRPLTPTGCLMSRTGRWIHPSAPCSWRRRTKAWSGSRTSVKTMIMCCSGFRSRSAPASCGLRVGSIRWLAEYFAGERRDFVLPLDLRLAHGFRRAVLGHLMLINYGHTQSYAEVAAATGRARAVRAVGTACATNPMPVVVPCHRVLRSDGTLGGYIGGLEAKATLLSLESGRPIDRDTLSR